MPDWPGCPLEGSVGITFSNTYRVCITDDHLQLEACQLPHQGYLSALQPVEVPVPPDHVACRPQPLPDGCELCWHKKVQGSLSRSPAVRLFQMAATSFLAWKDPVRTWWKSPAPISCRLQAGSRNGSTTKSKVHTTQVSSQAGLCQCHTSCVWHPLWWCVCAFCGSAKDGVYTLH